MATFWEIAVHLVDHMFSLHFDYLELYLFPVLVSIAEFRALFASVPDLCVLFTFVKLEYH